MKDCDYHLYHNHNDHILVPIVMITIVNPAPLPPSLPRPVVRFSHAIWSRATQSSAVLEDIGSSHHCAHTVLSDIWSRPT